MYLFSIVLTIMCIFPIVFGFGVLDPVKLLENMQPSEAADLWLSNIIDLKNANNTKDIKNNLQQVVGMMVSSDIGTGRALKFAKDAGMDLNEILRESRASRWIGPEINLVLSFLTNLSSNLSFKFGNSVTTTTTVVGVTNTIGVIPDTIDEVNNTTTTTTDTNTTTTIKTTPTI